MLYAEIRRLKEGGGGDCFELGFGEQEATPDWVMKLGIRLHLEELLVSNTVSKLWRFGVKWCHSTVYNWVRKGDLQPTEDKSLDYVAVDETVIQVDNQRYWLYAAIDPGTNEFRHANLCKAQNLALSEIFFHELGEKHGVVDVMFLVDGAPWLQESPRRHGLRFHYVTHVNRNAIERLYKDIKRRTNQF